MHCYLTFKEDKESLLDRDTPHPRIEYHSPDEKTIAHHLTSIAKEEEDTEEHFPTVSLDENVWMEEPVLERHLCIHEDSLHNLCPYPCPYSLD